MNVGLAVRVLAPSGLLILMAVLFWQGAIQGRPGLTVVSLFGVLLNASTLWLVWRGEKARREYERWAARRDRLRS